MILQTMTPEEKVRQTQYLLKYLYTFGESWLKIHSRTFFRTKTFPECYSSDMDLTGLGFGKWTMLIIVESKSNLRKGIATFRMYQTYHIAYAKDPDNIGSGIYEVVPDDDGSVRCEEFTPHYFNRIRQRMIEQKGIVQPSFGSLVKRLVCDHWSSMDETIKGFKFKKDDTGRYALTHESSWDRKSGYDNLVGYHKDGISLGVSAVNRNYFLWTTYVPNSMLYQDQIDLQQRRLNELKSYELRKRYNPFYSYEQKEWRQTKTDKQI